MPDRSAITKRFIACFPGKQPAELAKLFAVTPPTVFQWLSGVREVPWRRVKELADTQAISWDWLIEGHGSKHTSRAPLKKSRPFDWPGINRRFLSLFPDLSQEKIGEILGVRQISVFRWRHNKSNVSWTKLEFAVANQSVTWEWLLEGNPTIFQ